MGSEIRVRISPGICFWLALMLLVLPLNWVAAWLLSMAVHEWGHLLAVRLVGVPVDRVWLGPTGARIETGPMTPGQELLCAAAGPLAGATLLLVGRWFPLVAIFALGQTVFNLLPFGNLDGARILRLVRKSPCKPGQERVQ